MMNPEQYGLVPIDDILPTEVHHIISGDFENYPRDFRDVFWGIDHQLGWKNFNHWFTNPPV